jgi:hypothetical protein
MTAAEALGLAAGLLQAIAYIVYVLQVVRAECRPNGMTWLMWSYGTLVLLIIEWDVGAPVSILILPAVCAFCSLFVAGYAFARGAYIAPDPQDWVVLGLDVLILAGYVAFAHGLAGEAGGDADRTLVFVFLTGATTLTSSWPILRTTFLQPGHERPAAWFVWCAAYASMGAAMILEGLTWQYGVYPVLSLAIHLAIGFFALNRGKRPAPRVAGGGPARVRRP